MGILRCTLMPEQEATVTQIEEMQISPRRKEKVYTLESGEKIIVTERKFSPRPSGIDGILLMENGRRQWISHRLLDEYNQRATNEDWTRMRDERTLTWKNAFQFRTEELDNQGKVIVPGLRAPQIGALHAIGAHWTLSAQPATVVMPTGTGKTETMLAALVTFMRGTVLVVVPTKALVEQTAKKFLSLGLLRKLGHVPMDIQNPIIAVIDRRPKSRDDLEVLSKCHVAITTASAIAQGDAADYIQEIANRCSYLVLDEAHHVPSDSWSALREAFVGKPVIQFTATPFRRDGRPVDGKTIYNYPLHRAQQDGFFKPINFRPVFEIDAEVGDRSIAQAAVNQLQSDIDAGKDHLLMARCGSISRATQIFTIYESLGRRHRPIIIHNKSKDVPALLEKLHNRESRIVVCVDMLGEGFDLPQLKVAAIHDTHKSLATLLQFTGRFTRTAGDDVGEATVIANIANQEVSTALERLYSEDADWNQLLNEFSSAAVRDHLALSEFLRNSKRIDEPEEGEETSLISPNNLIPKFSTVVWKSQAFHPKLFFEGIDSQIFLHAAWLNESARTLFFITKAEPRVAWGRAKALRDRVWDLFIIYHNQEQELLFIHSTDHDSLHQNLANAVSRNTAQIISGDTIFRCLGGIARLMFQNIGLKRHGRRNLRYSMYSGSDVANALTPAQKASSTKSNVFGNGFEKGHPVTVGCSYKGRIWSREQGSIQRLLSWCDEAGLKLNDSSINTEQIIENVLIPKPIGRVPDRQILCIDWPRELLDRHEDRIQIISRLGELPFSQYGIELESVDLVLNEIRFRIIHDTHQGTYILKLQGGENENNPSQFAITHGGGEQFTIRSGSIEVSLAQWFNDYPPNILYVDGSELEGCDLIEPKERELQSFPTQQIETWDWQGVDLTKESIWKNGEFRTNSIQQKTADELRASSFDVIFNDDSAGEAADLVCLKEEEDHVLLKLIHCKFSAGETPGERVKDVVDVASQAVRSSRWIWRFAELAKHLLAREAKIKPEGADTRFIIGDAKKLNYLLKANRFKKLHAHVVIVQPGLSKAHLTDDQAMVLSAAHSYLLETVNVGLDVICSE